MKEEYLEIGVFELLGNWLWRDDVWSEDCQDSEEERSPGLVIWFWNSMEGDRNPKEGIQLYEEYLFILALGTLQELLKEVCLDVGIICNGI